MADTDGSLRERKRRETWQALRSAAITLVSERGLDGVSVDEIAAAANVSKRTLFNYFSSKEDLIFGPDPAEPARLAAIAEARPADEPIWDSLREILLGYVNGYPAKLALHKRLLAASPGLAAHYGSSTAVVESTIRQWVSTRLSGDDDPLQPALLVGAALTVLRAAFAVWQPDEGFDQLAALVRDGFDRVGGGLGGPPSR
ncbi:TetR/AcrR family transcriptional regulator [Cryptosporangium aurantiacum]|uniref:Transcriptional regulator, TetR family n=1 Tax=Cryptosporangium aurantiacum TaxID=134849 RepID=A0A1M7PEV0_9ACTN|nr:TetR/AcrR family transcriptional regulator [Cryptosporangium aurantiacum]SHN15569.1 transcriptional regulator, TetR family [Cryptosporangium aurantiacum]